MEWPEVIERASLLVYGQVVDSWLSAERAYTVGPEPELFIGAKKRMLLRGAYGEGVGGANSGTKLEAITSGRFEFSHWFMAGGFSSPIAPEQHFQDDWRVYLLKRVDGRYECARRTWLCSLALYAQGPPPDWKSTAGSKADWLAEVILWPGTGKRPYAESCEKVHRILGPGPIRRLASLEPWRSNREAMISLQSLLH